MQKLIPSLRDIFSVVDEAIGMFIKEHDLRGVAVLQYHWDAPDRTIEFLSPTDMSIRDSINVLYYVEVPRRLRVTGEAWRDEDVPTTPPGGQRRRLWVISEDWQDEKWSVVLDDKPPAVREVLEGLNAAYSELSSWGIDRLKNETLVP